MSSEVFRRLAGNPGVAQVLYDAAAHPEHMTHAWLFSGPPGAGRSTTALAFAAALVCDTPGAHGCGQCNACQTVYAGTHPDVYRLVPDSVVIPVSLIRETVIPLANTAPTHSRWRIVIIEDADRLGSESSNALLKTVEEPPAHTVIIFCAPSTDPEDFSITLRSRCRHIYVPTPSPEHIAAVLSREEGVSPERAALAAAASNGHIGRARRLAHDEQAQRRRERVLNLAELINHGATAFHEVGDLIRAINDDIEHSLDARDATEMDALKQSLGVGAKGKGTTKALRGIRGDMKDLEQRQKRRRRRATQDALDLALTDLAGLYRDVLMCRTLAAEPARSATLVHPDYEPLAVELAAQLSVNNILACIDAIHWCRTLLAHNVRPTVAVDGLVGKLRMAYGVA